MKRFSLLLFGFILLLHVSSYAQQDTIKVKSVEEAINASLENFRQKIKDDKADIYIITEVNLEKSKIDFAKNGYSIEPGINAKNISYGKKMFVLKFIVSMTGKQTLITCIQFRLKKKSEKAIALINLMSGNYYEVVYP
ncbi:hypothetical protein [Taibaiella koreensis]|uniref:hypothetical protein n=1 Tax=Taibaiella koreensis TaxID=1268548 RepID=UPI000E599583|nr:hypothetical protein [Taibaiella koreensis]